MPRTQETICGAPKAMAIPRMAPKHQPHDIRFAMAIAPSAMTKMMAIGVNQASKLLCRAVAPVMNGELCACARATTGGSHRSAARIRGGALIRRRARETCMERIRFLDGSQLAR